MQKLAVLVLVFLVAVPAAVAAEDAPGISASAERLAAEMAAAQDTGGGGSSVAKRVTSIALTAAGIGAVLAGNPEYIPSQFVPGNYPNRVDISTYLGPGRYPGHSYRLRHRRGDRYGTGFTCRAGSTRCWLTAVELRDQYRWGYTDGYDDGIFAGAVQGHRDGWREGYSAGQTNVIQILDANGFVVYDGEFDPASYVRETFSDRKGMRYGGVGLIAVGAILNFVWPDSPARLSAGPLRGGGQVGATFGF
jgi:hypothetical protein